MTKVILLVEKNNEDFKKIDWLKEELEKREIEVVFRELKSEEEIDFEEALRPDTIILAKGNQVNRTLSVLSERKAGLKGIFLILDDSTQPNINGYDLEEIKKKALNFFIYTFVTNEKITKDLAETIANKLESELFELEGAKDNSDYEDILIDIISIEQQI